MESNVKPAKMKHIRGRIIPGFYRNFSFSIVYLLLIVVIPLAGLVFRTFQIPFDQFISILASPRVLAAFRLSFGISLLAGIISLIAGVIIAWVLVRYRFPGRKLFDAIIDIPFAMPTAVSGITLATLYSSEGWIGKYLEKIGIYTAYTPLGILIALIFIGLPFIVRSIQPSLEEIESDMEEASACLGATRSQTLRKIVFPQILPSILTGFSMAVARGLGEYGSVIFIAGNIPHYSEIVPLLIVIELEQFDYDAASVISVMMLGVSFALILLIGLLQKVIVKSFVGEKV